jgi:hypothetical protein
MWVSIFNINCVEKTDKESVFAMLDIVFPCNLVQINEPRYALGEQNLGYWFWSMETWVE